MRARRSPRSPRIGRTDCRASPGAAAGTCGSRRRRTTPSSRPPRAWRYRCGRARSGRSLRSGSARGPRGRSCSRRAPRSCRNRSPARTRRLRLRRGRSPGGQRARAFPSDRICSSTDRGRSRAALRPSSRSNGRSAGTPASSPGRSRARCPRGFPRPDRAGAQARLYRRHLHAVPVPRAQRTLRLTSARQGRPSKAVVLA